MGPPQWALEGHLGRENRGGHGGGKGRGKRGRARESKPVLPIFLPNILSVGISAPLPKDTWLLTIS